MFKRIVFINFVNGYGIYYDRIKKIPLKAKESSNRKYMYGAEMSLGTAIFLTFLIGNVSFDINPNGDTIISWQIIISSILLYISYKLLYYPKGYEPASYEEFYYALYKNSLIKDNKNDEVVPLIKGILIFGFLIVGFVCLLLQYHNMMNNAFFDYSESGSRRISPFAMNFISTPLLIYVLILITFICPFYTIINCFRRFRNRKYINQEKIYQKKPEDLNIYPLGSVVKIKGSDDKYIIINRAVEIEENDNKKYYDYSAYKLEEEIDQEKEYKFNHWDITEIIHLSYFRNLHSEQDYELIYPLLRKEKYDMIYRNEEEKIPNEKINIINSIKQKVVNENLECTRENLKIGTIIRNNGRSIYKNRYFYRIIIKTDTDLNGKLDKKYEYIIRKLFDSQELARNFEDYIECEREILEVGYRE